MPKITELYAYVIADTSEDDEGVPSISTDFGHMPLMGADYARAKSLRTTVEKIAKQFGKSIKLVRSTGLQTVEVIEP